MASQLKEIVVDTDLLDTEQLSPDTCDSLLDLVSRSDILICQSRSRMGFSNLICRPWDLAQGLKIDPLRNPGMQITDRNNDLAQRTNAQNAAEGFDALIR